MTTDLATKARQRRTAALEALRARDRNVFETTPRTSGPRRPETRKLVVRFDRAA